MGDSTEDSTDDPPATDDLADEGQPTADDLADDGQPTADDLPPEATCYCPVGGVMDLLSRTYAMQVVCVVGAVGPVRYGTVEAAFDDVSSSTLSTRLEELTDAGLLERTQYDEIPPRVEYDLTPAGAELCDRLEPVLAWAQSHEDLGAADDGGS